MFWPEEPIFCVWPWIDHRQMWFHVFTSIFMFLKKRATLVLLINQKWKKVKNPIFPDSGFSLKMFWLFLRTKVSTLSKRWHWKHRTNILVGTFSLKSRNLCIRVPFVYRRTILLLCMYICWGKIEEIYYRAHNLS